VGRNPEVAEKPRVSDTAHHSSRKGSPLAQTSAIGTGGSVQCKIPRRSGGRSIADKGIESQAGNNIRQEAAMVEHVMFWILMRINFGASAVKTKLLLVKGSRISD
jgi:hypothetical protein